MRDGHPARQASSGMRDDPGPDRTRLLLGGGLAVVLLAVIGASGGWLLAAEESTPTGRSVAVATVPPTGAPPATPTPTRTTSPVTRTTVQPTAAGLTVPELVGTDFAAAREELRDRKLGWRLLFGSGTGRAVERTSPEAGTPVRRGVTVTLWVAGPPPAVAVPDLLGDDCDDAADDLVEAGLYPRYRTGRTGTVTAQEPAPAAAARWNDVVALSCSDEDSLPYPTASPAA